ncbi:hypothetical protein M408DRAFT_62241 [Serendipita vermifera MAFF 305830]|uniref:Cation efflux protein cytoplasmic domain-containing protein n=1 Tax=Serendipita vermifera MAFF 305830 TaxID=933852 RepID=A0A0C3BNI1_SERVB|nr:hypothetical protein M408DRAFT_62241 [Serendipita vermifera MAFF 305830]
MQNPTRNAERFVFTEISNPMLVVIVGCFGLASNILGLFLFHEHGHGHDHGDGGHSHSHDPSIPKVASPRATNGEREPLLINGSTTPPMSPSAMSPSGRKRTDSIDSISLFGHPIQNRAKIITTAQDIASSYGRATSPPSSPLVSRSHSRQKSSTSLVNDAPVLEESDDEHEGTVTPHAPAHRSSGARSHSHSHSQSHSHSHAQEPSADVERGRKEGHHHHGSMNMRALLLHVLGDALGNVGVISSGLIIWQTTWKWRYYSDPVISLFITMIIFSSALPLVKSASYILLQGVPEDIKLDDLRVDIGNVEGVVSVHELHVWQLSETKHIASVHIRLDQKADYMHAVIAIRKILHRCDIHNATIQPEFEDMPALDGQERMTSCLVACPPGACDADQSCCREWHP